VIRLDIPGGLLSSTRDIVKDILGAPLPVIVYVAPSGAGAASAGTFIALSAHVAAMAPGTNIGAAHAVAIGGGEVTGVMGEKLENFVASYGEAIARQRGRNVEWAIKAVRESASIGAAEAGKLNVVDLVAESLDELLEEASKLTVEINGKKTTLALSGAEVHSLEMTLSQKFISFIANPTIAYFLLMIGILGLYLEFTNPGMIYPGVVGVIGLLLGAAAFQVLPINYTGLALIALGVGLLIAEVFVTSFGVLGIGGIVSFVLGSLILFDSPGETLAVDRSVIFSAAATLGAAILIVGYLVVKSQGRKPTLGTAGLVGETGEVISRIAPLGKVGCMERSGAQKAMNPSKSARRLLSTKWKDCAFQCAAHNFRQSYLMMSSTVKSHNRTELLWGFFVLVAIIGMIYVAIGLGRIVLGTNGYIVYADFVSVSGVNVGDAVRIAGVNVGTVESISLADYRARVGLRIKDEVTIQKDAMASITIKGLVGDKTVAIGPGNAMQRLSPETKSNRPVRHRACSICWES
jgi:membrane-bound serine protease (ClpP class)